LSTGLVFTVHQGAKPRTGPERTELEVPELIALLAALIAGQAQRDTTASTASAQTLAASSTCSPDTTNAGMNRTT
jgi:hypothetical protein